MDRPRWKSAVKPTIKLILTALILVAVARHVLATRRQLQDQGRSIQIDAGWIAAGVVLYLAGLCACGLFYARVLKSSPTPVSKRAAVRAYLISHLGKYVPGKAMVVLMRVALVTPYGARPATAAFATLYETLAMMASGGLVAAFGFVVGHGGLVPIPLPKGLGLGAEIDLPLALLGLGLGLMFLILIAPPVFPKLAALIRLPLPTVGADAPPRITGRLLIEGLGYSAVGWILMGLSQAAVLRALSVPGVGVGQWPAVIASVALATVAGFVVPISPGGLGVREWVLWTSLASTINQEIAVVAALALRLTWVIGEVLAAAVLSVLRPPLPSPSSP
ncbi:MAG: lysylphosphatidylglycerol synthase domain-containing protein [Isosphaeraceae bacterium]